MVSSNLERTTKLTGKPVNELWKIVEEIVLAGYLLIKKKDMRDSFYHVREILSKKIGTTITIEQYYYFLEKFNYYRDDKWPKWEEKHSITRPTCKDPSYALYNASLKGLAFVKEGEFFFSRCQGFIFIEKSGLISQLESLSSYGWVILAGQGQSTREMREQIAKNYPGKPILVVHDFDYSGKKIFDVFEEGSRRTKHLNLVFENVVDLGLRKEDVEDLGLPIEPEAEKYRDKQKWRVELNALTVLTTRRNIENPLLWYIIKRMKEEGIPLYKEEQSSFIALKWEIGYRIRKEFEDIIEPIITKVLEDVKDEQIIEVELAETVGLKVTDEFKQGILRLSQTYLAKSEYVDSFEREQEILFEAQVIEELKEIKRRKPNFEIGV